MKKEAPSLSSDKAIKSAEVATGVRACGYYDKDAQNPDSLAKHFLNRKDRFLLWAFRESRGLQKLYKGAIERSMPGFYWYLHVRTKHIDAVLTESIDAGVQQFVILGAGYDSRPYRFREKLEEINIFEVDFPGTQSRKKEKLIEFYGSLPEHVAYVPIDFNSQAIKDVLLEKGYDPDKKTFFIWEGVTYYLPKESIDAVLEFIACNSSTNSLIVFDYALCSFIEGNYSTYGSQQLAEALKKVGEPVLYGIEEGQTASMLNEKGFSIISDFGPEELEQMYVTRDNGEQMGRIFGFMRIVYASVMG